MKIVPIKVDFPDELNIGKNEAGYRDNVYKKIEEAGRTCYKSKNKEGSREITESFINGLILSGHTSVIEHMNFTVRIICDRGTSHQLVRHRHTSISQQSTRYVSSVDMEVVKPISLEEGTKEFDIWEKAMLNAEKDYAELLDLGVSKDIARAVLPISAKTEIVLTTNVREWREIIKQRISKYAHENAREVAKQLLILFHSEVPVLFDDIYQKEIVENKNIK